MPDIWKKLNLKDQSEVVVLNCPTSFETAVDSLSSATVRRDLDAVSTIELLIAFVTRQDEVATLAAAMGPKAPGDPVIWFAYPKASSKRYQCELKRDTGWQALGDEGFEAVRQVAIDEDWSALRFRRVEKIKTMKRDSKRKMTEAARAR